LSRNVDKELPLLCVIIQKGAVLIGKFCGWFGNRWSAGGGRDPGPVNTSPFSFCLRGLGN
jgi:hypothetical protein